MTKYIGTVGRMWNKFPPDYFMDSWDNLIEFSNRYICGPGEAIHKTKATVSWHEMGRNQIVEESLGDWVLMLDTDHMFAPDLLDRLLFYRKKYNTRVLSGLYQYKFPPHAPVMNLWNGNSCAPIIDWNREEEVIEVGSVGAGCLLVDTSVYKEIKDKTGNNPFDIIQGLSEDYSFCRRCKDLDITINVATKVQCHHVIETVLSIDDYKPDISAAYKVSGDKGIIL